jgi:hypothetical protein
MKTSEQSVRFSRLLPALWMLLLCGCPSEDSFERPAGETEPHRAAESKKTSVFRQKKRDLPADEIPALRIVGPDSGFEFERFDDISGKRRIMETNGGGVALFDFDRNGRLDLFVTNGCRLPCRSDDRGRPSQLFQNSGELRYRKAAKSAGVVLFGFSTGCAVGDFDNDGFDDLYVTAAGNNSFWRNNGDGTFSEITGLTGTAVPEWSSSAAFGDLNNDGNLDLYVVNYLDESMNSPRLCPNPQSPDGYEGCSPALFDGVRDALFLGDGQGGFSDVTKSSRIGDLPGKGLGVVIADFDQNGRQEIYVANDGEANFLFVATPDEPVYEEVALQHGIALNERGFAQASMGIAAGDYDANGTTDLFLTHFYGDTNTLYAHQQDLTFIERTRGSGLGASSRQTLGFGTVFFDYDNDGWLDLFVANGHVDDRTWMPSPQPYKMPSQLYRNQKDGTFVDVSDFGGEYFERDWLGRGAACGDLNNDGREDLVVSHQLDRSVVLLNETPTPNSSLLIQLAGTVSNRNGFGAKVSILTDEPELFREMVGGASFQSASALEIHAGVAKQEEVTVQIRWPSGIEDRYDGCAPGRWVAIEGQSMKPLP